jgi:hypothetical protein
MKHFAAADTINGENIWRAALPDKITQALSKNT